MPLKMVAENSTRYGCSVPAGKMSIIPPRRDAVPGWSARCSIAYPAPSSRVIRSPGRIPMPTVIVNPSASIPGGAQCSEIADHEATTSPRSSRRNSPSACARSTATEGSSRANSYGNASRSGSRASGTSSRKNVSSSCSACARAGVEASNRTGLACRAAIAAATGALAVSGTPRRAEAAPVRIRGWITSAIAAVRPTSSPARARPSPGGRCH